MKKLTVVFPCAGKAERFGNTFKPFLKIGDLTFIEKAYEPFEKWQHMIQSVCFIITKNQEKEFNVTKKLQNLFPNINVHVSILEHQTEGPLQTFTDGFVNTEYLLDKDSPFIVCDCDHSINVDNLFSEIANNKNSQIIIPTWNIDESIQHNWSKILLQNNRIVKFVNKEDVDFQKYTVKGIIGCIFFRSAQMFTDVKSEYHNFYEIISDQFANNIEISLSDAANAYFYGDPTMLSDCVDKRRKECSIFCDIDGVLLKHSDHSTTDPDLNECLDGYGVLEELKNSNHKIVLTTARNKKYKEGLEKLLREKNIHYDELVMSLPSGPRILINDRKPSKPFTPQASSYEIERNSGLKNFTVDNIVRNSDIRIVKDLSANSFAKTYLIEKDGINLVRKIVSKSDGKKHVDVLKRQKHDLERFNFLHNGLCPNVIDSGETDIDYYYDMEYLPHHKMLSDAEDYTTTLRVFRNTLDVMQENVYSLSKPVNGERWMKTFLNEKIYPKFDNFKLQSDEFNVIIESDEFYINKQKYVGLKKLFQNLSYEKLSPQNISVVHGDLTFENILYNPDNFSVKLIDMDGSRLYDAKELDLGKMSQSVLSNYNTWKSMDGDRLITGFEDSHFKANSSFFNSHVVVMPSNLMHFWQPILKQPVDVVTRKAYFYMSTYFIRFVPFRMQLGKEHGVFALLMATAWLNKLLE